MSAAHAILYDAAYTKSIDTSSIEKVRLVPALSCAESFTATWGPSGYCWRTFGPNHLHCQPQLLQVPTVFEGSEPGELHIA